MVRKSTWRDTTWAARLRFMAFAFGLLWCLYNSWQGNDHTVLILGVTALSYVMNVWGAARSGVTQPLSSVSSFLFMVLAVTLVLMCALTLYDSPDPQFWRM